MNHSDDLLREARAGRNEALGQLFEHYKPTLLRIVHGILRSRSVQGDTSHDMVQEAFAIALDKFSSFRGGVAAQLRAWLITIVHRYVLRRLKQSVKAPVSLENIPEPEDCRLDQEMTEFWEMMNLLETDDQDIINLRLREGWEYSELAAAFDLDVAAVRKRFSRALRRLRELYGE